MSLPLKSSTLFSIGVDICHVGVVVMQLVLQSVPRSVGGRLCGVRLEFGGVIESVGFVCTNGLYTNTVEYYSIMGV